MISLEEIKEKQEELMQEMEAVLKESEDNCIPKQDIREKIEDLKPIIKESQERGINAGYIGDYIDRFNACVKIRANEMIIDVLEKLLGE